MIIGIESTKLKGAKDERKKAEITPTFLVSGKSDDEVCRKGK